MSQAMTPRDKTIYLAREAMVSQGVSREFACEAALVAVPACKLSRDQLKALAFGAVLHGFGAKAPASGR